VQLCEVGKLLNPSNQLIQKLYYEKLGCSAAHEGYTYSNPFTSNICVALDAWNAWNAWTEGTKFV